MSLASVVDRLVVRPSPVETALHVTSAVVDERCLRILIIRPRLLNDLELKSISPGTTVTTFTHGQSYDILCHR